MPTVVQTEPWERRRDTTPPVTQASLAHPETLLFLAATGVSVTNSSAVALSLAGLGEDFPCTFR
jgi:hypothetical protein